MPLIERADTNVTIAAPYVFPPSGQWDGNDGNWSSFHIGVGTPPQNSRVLIGTISSQTWVVGKAACGDKGEECAESRGVEAFNSPEHYGFEEARSTSWTLLGNLGTTQAHDKKVEGIYGLDTIRLNNKTTDPTVLGQLVAGLTNDDYYLGQLGLGIKPEPITVVKGEYRPILRSLKENGLIPSLSYGYTAGSSYSNPPQFASLTLGGYDQSRFTKGKDLNFTFNEDGSQVLNIPLNGIVVTKSTSGSQNIQTGNINAVIDSAFPFMYLSPEVCKKFQDAFGLFYAQADNYYSINATMRKRNLDSDATVTFVFGSDLSKITNIVLPYKALELNIGTNPPVGLKANQTYFPLRQTSDQTQYTLGRAFLQEAYVIVDYERSTFSINQVASQSGVSKADIVPILPVDIAPTNSGGVAPKHVESSNSLSAGAKAGIAVGCILVVAIAIGGWLFLRRRPKNKTSTEKTEKHISYEIGGTEFLEAAAVTTAKHELPGTPGKLKPPEYSVYEVDGHDGPRELGTGSLKGKVSDRDKAASPPPQELPA